MTEADTWLPGRLVTLLQFCHQLLRGLSPGRERLHSVSDNSHIHSFTHSLIHFSLAHSLFIHSLVHSFSHSFIHIHPCTHSLAHSHIHPIIRSCLHSLTYSFTHSFMHSPTPSLIHQDLQAPSYAQPFLVPGLQPRMRVLGVPPIGCSRATGPTWDPGICTVLTGGKCCRQRQKVSWEHHVGLRSQEAWPGVVLM